MTILNDFVHLFFPSYCYGCDQSLVQGEKVICAACDYNLPRTNYHLERNNPVRLKFSGKIPVEDAMSFLRFSRYGLTQKLMHKLKYDNRPEIAEWLGERYANDIIKTNRESHWDIIVPVPLHKSKLNKRGYNQSDYWAKGLANGLQVSFQPNVLSKMQNTDSQTRKSRAARWQNVKGSFVVEDPQAIKNKNVLLVDDVITSGATLEACGIQLIKANCKTISIATIATA